MRAMVPVNATDDSGMGILPTTKPLRATEGRSRELVDDGIMAVADGFKPSSPAAPCGFVGPGRTLLDGPFAATRESVAGVWLW